MFSLLGILMASFHNGVCMYVYFGRFKMAALKVYILQKLVFIHNYVLCICYCGYVQLVIVDVVLSQIYYCSYLMMFE